MEAPINVVDAILDYKEEEVVDITNNTTDSAKSSDEDE